MEGRMFVGIIKGENGKWFNMFSNGKNEYEYEEHVDEYTNMRD